jgi:hypothetical protein
MKDAYLQMAIPQEKIEQGAKRLYTCLESALAEKKGCCIGRNGSTELTTLFYFDRYRILNTQIGFNLQRYSGIFPPNVPVVDEWIQIYKQSLQQIDEEPIVAGWFEGLAPYEKVLLEDLCPKAAHIPLRSLEPYYVAPSMRWTNLLAGKRVAVVSSFANTIASQVSRARDIWGEDSESLLPSTTTWVPIQTGFPPTIAKGKLEWPEGCSTWKEAVDWLEQQVLVAKADVCLIGCGGLGMILGTRLKQKGIPCVVLGGAIQVLFGIKGQRWQAHSVIGKFWNDAWVWPSVSETPGGSGKIEGGCYWNPTKE